MMSACTSATRLHSWVSSRGAQVSSSSEISASDQMLSGSSMFGVTRASLVRCSWERGDASMKSRSSLCSSPLFVALSVGDASSLVRIGIVNLGGVSEGRVANDWGRKSALGTKFHTGDSLKLQKASDVVHTALKVIDAAGNRLWVLPYIPPERDADLYQCAPRIVDGSAEVELAPPSLPYCIAGTRRAPGMHHKSLVDSTEAIKQALSFFSSAEDASDARVPAQDTSVRDFTGTKTIELMKPVSPTKVTYSVDDQLPSLLSMIIDGLPSIQQSEYVHEAEKRLLQYVKRYDNVIFLKSLCHASLASVSYMHSEAISVDRLVAISISYAVHFVVDDLFFDAPEEFFHKQYGVSHTVCASPEKIQEYLDHLDALLKQEVEPCNPCPLIETMVWESGRELLELSNPEWFANYVACVVEHHRANVASLVEIVQGRNLCFQDLESYTIMRVGNVGGEFVQLMIEFAKDTYIPNIMRVNPYLEKITTATSIHLGFANDIFSYYKESTLEQNPRNLITVLKESEGKSFVETVHMAIGLTNAYARAIIDLEVEPCNSTLQNYLQSIKALIAGHVYYSFMGKRFRHPNSVFPELRDMTLSWKIIPGGEGPEL